MDVTTCKERNYSPMLLKELTRETADQAVTDDQSTVFTLLTQRHRKD